MAKSYGELASIAVFYTKVYNRLLVPLAAADQEPRCTALLGRSAKPEIERIEHAGRQITGIR